MIRLLVEFEAAILLGALIGMDDPEKLWRGMVLFALFYVLGDLVMTVRRER